MSSVSFPSYYSDAISFGTRAIFLPLHDFTALNLLIPCRHSLREESFTTFLSSAVMTFGFFYRLNEEMEEIVHLFFYVADEEGTALGLGKGASDDPDDFLLAFGSMTDVGNWELHLESKVPYLQTSFCFLFILSP